jgi:isopentenyl-diphosphate delta-isomerase type 1
MLKTHKRSVFVAITLIFLAIGAFFMANVELPRWSYVISSINVLLFALPAFYALRRWLGWSDGIKLVLILGVYALLIETFAILTGFPYGHFGYSEHLGYKLFGYVPWTVAFAWTPLMLCAYVAARSLFASRVERIICSTFLLVIFDLVLDPGAVLLGFWQYPQGGAYYGVPASNYLGWMLSGALGSIIMEAVVSYFRPLLPPPVQIGSSAFFIMFFWTAFAVFGGLAVPAIIGCGVAAAMYAWYCRSYYKFDEMVVLVDDQNNALATAKKSETHNANTKLHRAFSLFLFNSKGELLLQQRAFTKKTWPGVWSNSCCGHVMINEKTEDAAARRLRFELGISGVDLKMVLPHFRYRAEKDGVVENEICPVLIGFTDQEPEINPSEVAETKWVLWSEFLRSSRNGESELSPWAIEEAELLSESEVFRRAFDRNIRTTATV